MNSKRLIFLILFFSLFFIGTGSAAISYVNDTNAVCWTGTPRLVTTSFTEGNVILVIPACWSGAINSVTDSQGNTYTAITPTQTSGSSQPISARGFYTVASATGVVTLNISINSDSNTAQIVELSGVNKTSPLSSYSMSDSGTISYTANASDAVVLMWHDRDTNTASLNNGFSFVTSDQLTTYGQYGVRRPVALKIVENYESSSCTLTPNEGTVYCGWSFVLKAEQNNPYAVVPSFFSNVSTGYVPLSIQFNDTSQYSDSRVWNFGDGNTSTSRNVTHTFYTAGNYSVSLNATNSTSGSFGVINQTMIVKDPVMHFHITGQTFQPRFTVSGNPTILIDYGDGTSSSSATPIKKDFGSVANRVINVTITPWNATTGINIGYDESDQGNLYSNFTSSDILDSQGVSLIENLDLVSSSLKWFSAEKNVGNNNSLPYLNFSGFQNLEDVECFGLYTSHEVNFSGCSKLRREVTEGNHIKELNISDCPLLQEIRSANQGGTDPLTIIWGSTGAHLWHLCVWGDRLVYNVPWSQIHNIRELYLDHESWDHYAVDESIAGLDALGTAYAGQSPFLTIQNNSQPGLGSVSHLSALRGRGWSIQVDESPIAYVPTANFSANVTSRSYPGTIQFTDTSLDVPDYWQWNFSDGTANSTSQNPIHTFGVGTHTITLTAGNSAGNNTTIKTGYITISQGVPVITWNNPASILTGTALSSTQLNAASSIPGTFVYDPPSDTVLSLGTHTLNTTFTPTDSTNYTTATASVSIDITSVVIPTANFSGSPLSGDYPLSVTFSDLSVGSPTSWAWSWGDGTSNSAAQNPSHQYNSAGTYNVTLTATNANGSNTQTKTGYITVSTPSGSNSPTAAFAGTPRTGNYPLNVSFTDQSTNSPDEWYWSFGDGNYSSLQNPTHTYYVAGSYNVGLWVHNVDGVDTENKTAYITATGPGTIALSNYSGENFSFSPTRFYVGQYDEVTLTDYISYDRKPFDLSSINIYYIYRNDLRTVKKNITCIGYSNGKIDIPVNYSNSGTSGTYFGQFILSDGITRITIPSSKYIDMYINKAL